MRTLRYVLLDVFTDRPLTGNPLAVFTDGRGLDATLMQRLARELNLSESVFVLPAEASGHARLRIFTPATELPFAGHPTLGAAFVLGGPLQSELVRLETGSGVVPVRLEREGATVVFGWMKQPIPAFRPFTATEELFGALGVKESALPVVEADNGARHVLVVVADADTVAGLTPDFAQLAQLVEAGIHVSAPSGDGSYRARSFAPALGVPEDPATGSAAGPLAVHLACHGRLGFGDVLRIEQGVELDRPSTLFAVARGTADKIENVEVGGAATVIGRGELQLKLVQLVTR
jgi:trans-2,3-dihydro-3-hydroxyanthranilate isomerase